MYDPPDTVGHVRRQVFLAHCSACSDQHHGARASGTALVVPERRCVLRASASGSVRMRAAISLRGSLFFLEWWQRSGAKVIKCEKSGFVPSFGRNGLAVGGEGMRSGRSVLKSAASLPRRWSRRPKRPGKWKTRRNHLFFGGVAEGWGESHKMPKD